MSSGRGVEKHKGCRLPYRHFYTVAITVGPISKFALWLTKWVKRTLFHRGRHIETIFVAFMRKFTLTLNFIFAIFILISLTTCGHLPDGLVVCVLDC